MSITVAELITNLDTYIGDTSTDRISQAERFQALTESVTWLQEELQNDHQIDTYTLPYFDTVHEYKITTAVADLLATADLRRDEFNQNTPSAHKSSREMASEIGERFGEFSYSVERRDRGAFLEVNLQSRFTAKSITDFDSLTDGGGTWVVDTTNSDAVNLTVDNAEFLYGNASLNFDVDVSQSGNNRATIYNNDLGMGDLTDLNDLSSFIMEVYIPDVTYITSITLFWGSSASAYWSNTVTTDINGSAFINGWNRVKFAWSTSTMTASPNITNMTYIRIDVNYSASQADDTDFRVDYLRLVRPENLKFYYTSWSVGQVSAADTTKIYAFTATTNVPYFSGQYDQVKFAVAHKAASILYNSPLRLITQSQSEEAEAIKQLRRVKKIVPKSANLEMHSFKVNGVNFRRVDSRRRLGRR